MLRNNNRFKTLKIKYWHRGRDHCSCRSFWKWLECTDRIPRPFITPPIYKQKQNKSPYPTKKLKTKTISSCREKENLVFWFGAQFNSTLNFTQSGWHILFSPDLHFRLAKRVSDQINPLQRETVTRTDVPLVVPA